MSTETNTDNKILISIIVTTYMQPEMLQLVLLALAEQDIRAERAEALFEVIIADDGSTPTTRQIVDDFAIKMPYHLQHVWQPDDGFRAAMIRNKAAAQASGNYLIFLDGDCIPRPSFVRKHWQLAENGYFVAGNRVLLNKEFTAQVIANKIAIYTWNLIDWIKARFKGYCNRVLPFFNFPVAGFLSGIRKWCQNKKWHGAKSCNLALWKKDFLAVNGFDESYAGWGYEDSDLVIRLLRNNVQRKCGKFAVPVIHLWHAEKPRDEERANYSRLDQLQESVQIRAGSGVDKYLAKKC